MKKDWYKSITVWGCVLLFVGGGLEAMGVSGAMEMIKQLAYVFGVPLTGIGFRRAMS